VLCYGKCRSMCQIKSLPVGCMKALNTETCVLTCFPDRLKSLNLLPFVLDFIPIGIPYYFISSCEFPSPTHPQYSHSSPVPFPNTNCARSRKFMYFKAHHKDVWASPDGYASARQGRGLVPCAPTRLLGVQSVSSAVSKRSLMFRIL
jgi:hypothetical protein